MTNFAAWINVLDTWVQRLLILLMALLLVDVTWQVVTRFVLPQPSSFTEELARFLLIWIGLLGSAHAYRHKMHLGVDLFSNKLSPNHKRNLNRFVQLIVIAFAIAVLVYGGSQLSLLAFHLNQVSASMQVNMGLIYLALPISGALFCVYAIEQYLFDDPTLNAAIEPDKHNTSEGDK